MAPETWLKDINVLEVSPTPRPANRRGKLFQKAAWSTAFVDSLPDSAFLYVEGGGEKDGEGKTVPRTLRHFPVRDEAGKIDGDHLRDAIGRIPQATGLSPELKTQLQAHAQKLLEEENAKENSMATKKNAPSIVAPSILEAITKAEVDPDVAAALKKALAAVQGVMEKLDPEDFTEIVGAIAGALNPGKEPTSDQAAPAAPGMDQIQSCIKKSIALLDSATPNVAEAVNLLAAEVGVTPMHKHLADLPPELKAQWEAMTKSNADNAKALEEMKKHVAQVEYEKTERTWVAKCAGIAGLPTTAERAGKMLAAIAKHSPEQATEVERLLKSVSAHLDQAGSTVFDEMGKSGTGTDAETAFAQLEHLADELVQKSAGTAERMTKAQAIREAARLRPDLVRRHSAERQ